MGQCHFSQLKLKHHKICFKCDFKLCIIIINKRNVWTSLCFYLTTNFKGMLLILKSVSSQTLFYSVSNARNEFYCCRRLHFLICFLDLFHIVLFLRGGLNYKFHFVKIIWKNTYRDHFVQKVILKPNQT